MIVIVGMQEKFHHVLNMYIHISFCNNVFMIYMDTCGNIWNMKAIYYKMKGKTLLWKY